MCNSNNKCLCVFDTGEYICKLTLDIFEYGSRKKIDVTSIQIWANEDMKVMCDNNPMSLSCCSEMMANWSQVEWKQQGSVSIPGETVRSPSANRFVPLGQVKMGDAVGERANVRWLGFFPD